VCAHAHANALFFVYCSRLTQVNMCRATPRLTNEALASQQAKMQEDMAVRLEDQRLSLEAKVSAVEDKGTRLLHCITPVDNQHALTDASCVC
jgi:hypothetical protein